MRAIKPLLKDWLPPALLRRVKYLSGKGVSFEGNYKSWEEAASLCTGYDAELILEKVLDATLKVKRGQAVYERDSVLFDEIQYSWPVTTALMWAALRNHGHLHVMDFGGSLGSSFFQNRKFLSSPKSISWNIVEQSHFVDMGRRFIEDDILKFYSSIEESVKAVSPNVILLSSVVQYLKNPQKLFDQINSIEADILLIDRTPFSAESENAICIQNISSNIYKANYPMWLLSRSKMFKELNNWKVHESFASPEGCVISEAGLKFEFCGYMFEHTHG